MLLIAASVGLSPSPPPVWAAAAVVSRHPANNRPARRIGLPVKHTTELARDLDTIIGDGGRIYLVFSPEEYADRYFRVFGGPACQEIARGDGLELEYIDGGDHTFAPPGARRALIERMTHYLEARYPEPPLLGRTPQEKAEIASWNWRVPSMPAAA